MLPTPHTYTRTHAQAGRANSGSCATTAAATAAVVTKRAPAPHRTVVRLVILKVDYTTQAKTATTPACADDDDYLSIYLTIRKLACRTACVLAPRACTSLMLTVYLRFEMGSRPTVQHWNFVGLLNIWLFRLCCGSCCWCPMETQLKRCAPGTDKWSRISRFRNLINYESWNWDNDRSGFGICYIKSDY